MIFHDLFTFQELQAIEKYELDMIALGNQYIMKSHKGEIEIDKDEFIRDKEKGLLFSYCKYKCIFTCSNTDDNSELLKYIYIMNIEKNIV